MRTPHAAAAAAASLRDVPDDLPDCDGTGACCFPARGLCCPDDPLDLVLHLFPPAAPPPPHTAAADRPPPPPPPLSSLAALGIGGGCEPPRREQEQEQEKLTTETDCAFGGGGGAWELDSSSWGLSSSLLDGLGLGLEEIDVSMFLADGDAPDGSLGAAVPNDASPLPAGGALQVQPYDAFDFNNAPMPAGGPPPTALMPAAAPAAMPMSAVPGLHACGALTGRGIIISHGAPAPPPLPARAFPLHTGAAAPSLLAGGVYSSSNAPPSATPSPPPPPPPSRASSGSETEPPPAPAWVVPMKQRSLPPVNNRRRKRPWLLKFPLRALPAVVVVAPPPPTNPVADDDDAKKNRTAALVVPVAAAPPPLPGNTTGGGDDETAATAGGGFRKRRRLAPRQRNRQAQRVCSHCRSPETPQWRAGPEGPGTLCNACGIRFAGKRLLPEYRPSTAPSFRSGEHSNRHRKVIKLREQMTATATEEEEKPSSVMKLRGQMTAVEEEEEEKPSSVMKLREQMTAAEEENQPSERQPTMEDDKEEKDDGFLPGVCARTYQQQQACDTYHQFKL